MSQQVNLYQPIFRQQQKVFSAATLAQIIVIISLGLGLIYGYGRWQTLRLAKDVELLEAQRDQAQKQFDTLTAEVASRKDDTRLKADIERTEAELNTQQQLLTWLGARDTPRTAGFAGYLTGLARQYQNDLWVQGLVISDNGRVVTLTGGSRDPAAVVRYLRRLGQEPAFEGLEFRSVTFERQEASPSDVTFRVSSAEATTP